MAKKSQTKGTSVKVKDLDDLSEIEGVKPKADKVEQAEPTLKVTMLRSIRGSYGAYDAGFNYELESAFAQRLIDAGTAQLCSLQ